MLQFIISLRKSSRKKYHAASASKRKEGFWDVLCVKQTGSDKQQTCLSDFNLLCKSWGKGVSDNRPPDFHNAQISATWTAVRKGESVNRMLWIKTQSKLALTCMKTSMNKSFKPNFLQNVVHVHLHRKIKMCSQKMRYKNQVYRTTPTIIYNLWQFKLIHLIYLTAQ